MSSLPFSKIDLFSDGSLADPYPLYEQLRALGPVVYMEQGDFVAVTRYAEIRQVLALETIFVSGSGVGLNDAANAAMTGSLLASDGDEHAMMRKVLSEQLSPRGLRKIAADVQQVTDTLVRTLMDRGRFDAVTELAERLPTMVVLDLIGLPAEGREEVIPWAISSFNVFGPMSAPRTLLALQHLHDVFDYCLKVTQRGMLRPGSMGAALLDAVDAGTIPPEKASLLMLAYLTGGLDTTSVSIQQVIRLFAANAAQWDMIRADPGLVPGAYNEVLRHGTPIHWFSRLAKEDAVIGGVAVQAGSRVVPLFASGNRDPLKYVDPDAFDVKRSAADHLSFGYGTHGCAGQALARMEVVSLLRSLAAVVGRIEVTGQEQRHNNVVHGYQRIDAILHA